MPVIKEAANARYFGVVKWFSSEKGYGFIEWKDTANPDGKDIFVHYSGISASGYKRLYEGQKVEFSVEKGVKGLQAANVAILA